MVSTPYIMAKYNGNKSINLLRTNKTNVINL